MITGRKLFRPGKSGKLRCLWQLPLRYRTNRAPPADAISEKSRESLLPGSYDAHQAVMTHAQLTESVRALVAETFAVPGHGVNADFQESILIRDGNYCGRRFVCGGRTAIWFVEENQVKFFSPEGKLLHVVDAERTSLARAA
jgi:hypothetical protein